MYVCNSDTVCDFVCSICMYVIVCLCISTQGIDVMLNMLIIHTSYNEKIF